MRACAVEIHFKSCAQEPLYAEIVQTKNAAAQNLGPHFVRACTVGHALQHCTESHFKTLYGNLQEKMPRPRLGPERGTHTLCEPAQSTCTWKFYKSHFIRKFTAKLLHHKSGTHTLCEPAQSKCMLEISQEPALYGNLQVKCRRPRVEHPDQAPAFTSFTAIGSEPLFVWTHCLGKMLKNTG